MKWYKRALPVGLAGLMLAAAPVTALASSPEFARSAEEWASLQDDVLEYSEIPGLIHEYNATVQKNAIDLNEFKKDYGTTKEDVADRYRELADELESSLDYPDTDNTMYATLMTSIVSSETQIKNWRKTADDNVEDYETMRLSYEQAEAMLVTSAQNHMINYYLQQLQLASDERTLALQQQNLTTAITRRDVGTGTEVDVLTAQESIYNAQQSIQTDETSVENYHQRLLVLLGWKHDANPQIMPLPEVDLTEIDAIDLEADKALAKENNYTLRINRRKYENAQSGDTKTSLETTIRDNEENINANMLSAYRSLLASRTAYQLAEAQANLQQRTTQTTVRQYELGNASYTEYLNAQIALEQAQLSQQIAQLNLFASLQSYCSSRDGLASASAS